MPDPVDTASLKFEQAWAKVQDKVAALYEQLQSSGASVDGIVRRLGALDATKYVMEDLQFKDELRSIQAEYVRSLKNLTPGGVVPEEVLRGLMGVETQVYVGKIGASAAEIKRLLIQSVVTSTPFDVFSENLKATGLQPHQANALANDSIRKFRRNVIAAQDKYTEGEPKYVWAGPVDDKTSAECLQLISAGAMTRAEINAMFPGAFESGTHFGCRHQPEVQVRARQSKVVEAQVEAATRE